MKNKTIDDFVKITYSTVQDDEDEINEVKDGKIYGYHTDAIGGLVDGHKIYITPASDASDLNTSMINREWGDFMKYTGFSVEDIVDFIDRNVVNNPKTVNLSSY